MIHEPTPSARWSNRLLRRPTWWGWLAFACSLGVVIAIAVAQGRTKAWFGFIALSAALMLSDLQRATRLKVLLLAILATPLLLGGSVPIPADLTLSQSLLIFVVVGEAFTGFRTGRDATRVSVLGARYYVPFALFALLGLISTYINGELLTYWPEVCLVPLFLLFAVDRLADSEDDTMNLVRAAAVAIFAFVGIVWVAQVTGHTYLLPGGGGGVAGRFANGRGISLGPLSFSVFSIDVGSIAAIGMPAAVILALGARSRWARLFYVAMVLAFAAILAFTGARGAMIGAVSGTLLALLLSRRLTLRRIILGVLAAIMVLAVAGTRLVDLLPPAVVSAIGELRGGVGSVGDFRIRLGVWEVTLAAVSKNPLGPGFNYLYQQYHLDEFSVAYTMILSGTGVLGLCALAAMLFRLARDFLSGLTSRVSAAGLETDLAAIGLGTMATTLLAGVSASSVLVGPLDPIVFWTIMAAVAVGVARRRAPAPDAERSGAGDLVNGLSFGMEVGKVP